MLEIGCSHHILVATGAYRIESHGREHIPRRRLPVVLVAAITIGMGRIEAIHHLAQPVLGFPRLPAVVVKVNHVLDGLVAMGIVSHVHNLHFAYLMNHAPIVTIVENRRNDKHGVHHLIESSVAPHQMNQPLRIVKHAPRPVPSIALGEGIAPFEGTKGALEAAVLVASTHQIDCFVKHVTIVLCPLSKRLQFLSRLSERLTELINAPVIVSILERSGHILIDIHIIGHVAQLIIVFVSLTSRAANGRMYGIGTMLHGLPQGFGVGRANPFQIGVGHDRGGIIAHHATAMARTGPLRKESALPVSVGQTLLHLGVHRRINQIEEGEQAAEGVPEACISKHIARQHLAIIGTIMNRIAVFVDFVEASWEEHRPIEAAVERTQMVDIVVFHLDTAQHLVPTMAPLRHDFIEIAVAQLL